ncbi:MAG: metal-sensitive transcriptional regulator [Deltaproteobacteria bacterium]|nr:metal-sensitive transcriptional regulator [Deltaproteobacteria bacterium]
MGHSQHKKRDSVAKRLARIAGHVESIRRMVDEDRPCADLLQQMAAVMKAMEAARKELLEDHLEHCIIDAVKDGRTKHALSELKDTLRLVLR